MLSYHNDPKIKEEILRQLQAHYDHDEIVHGTYWHLGKGCAVGCTIYSNEHAEYEERFGIPQVLAHLEDRIFEGLENKDAKRWPLLFMLAIPIGADLSKVWNHFSLWLLGDPKGGVLQFARTTKEKEVTSRVIELSQQSLIRNVFDSEWSIAAHAAYNVAESYPTSQVAYAAARSANVNNVNAIYASYASRAASDVAGYFNKSRRYREQAAKLLTLLRQAT